MGESYSRFDVMHEIRLAAEKIVAAIRESREPAPPPQPDAAGDALHEVPEDSEYIRWRGETILLTDHNYLCKENHTLRMDLATARATVERVVALADRIEAEPLATGGHAETGQLGRLQVADEIRAALKGRE